ncbi:hypothetical protein BOX15_Mlig000802g2, partial [Macrostomum lignano]
HWLRLPANSRPAGPSLLIVGRMAASQLASTDEASQRRNRVYTVPNAITAGRLVAAPCVAACVLSGSYAPPPPSLWPPACLTVWMVGLPDGGRVSARYWAACWIRWPTRLWLRRCLCHSATLDCCQLNWLLCTSAGICF